MTVDRLVAVDQTGMLKSMMVWDKLWFFDKASTVYQSECLDDIGAGATLVDTLRVDNSLT
jgi:hypothetical protein